MVTVRAVTAFFSLFGAGGLRRYRPFAITVAQCGDVGIHIAVTAAAGVGSIALFGTGRIRYDRSVIVDMVQFRDHFFLRFATGLTGIHFQSRRVLRCGSFDNPFIPCVTLGRKSLLFHQNGVADGTMLALSQACFGTGCRYRLVGHFRVAFGGNNLLFHQNRVADGAVLALSQACFGTGCGYRFVGRFHVVLGGYNLLCHQNRVTDGTVLALSQACFATGCGNCLVVHFRVAPGGNNLLCHQNSVTDGAVLALSQACFGTGCSYCLVDHFRMALGGYNLLCHQNSVTDRTMFPFGQACFGTGCRYRFVGHFRVALGGYNQLFHQNGVADGTMLALGQACFGTGSIHRLVDDLGMAFGVDIGIHIAVTTGATSVGGITLLCTGGGGYYRIVAVARGRNFAGLVVVTVCAVTAFFSLFGASGLRRCRPFAIAVTQGGGFIIGIAITADGTGMGGVALLRTGGGGDCILIGMTVDGACDLHIFAGVAKAYGCRGCDALLHSGQREALRQDHSIHCKVFCQVFQDLPADLRFQFFHICRTGDIQRQNIRCRSDRVFLVTLNGSNGQTSVVPGFHCSLRRPLRQIRILARQLTDGFGDPDARDHITFRTQFRRNNGLREGQGRDIPANIK